MQALNLAAAAAVRISRILITIKCACLYGSECKSVIRLGPVPCLVVLLVGRMLESGRRLTQCAVVEQGGNMPSELRVESSAEDDDEDAAPPTLRPRLPIYTIF
ncbi:hypothetical protein TcasGA2_TC011640 [Tribolium castaneum]|uniref:Uncharacterized protein n=1 Tax=Tribolium castaneum TaxID=7070 RepID=D6X0X8_TRICA|nr:hypothetical protein TcasGA2_TC011640 [Tribolium castaneum]